MYFVEFNRRFTACLEHQEKFSCIFLHSFSVPTFFLFFFSFQYQIHIFLLRYQYHMFTFQLNWRKMSRHRMCVCAYVISEVKVQKGIVYRLTVNDKNILWTKTKSKQTYFWTFYWYRFTFDDFSSFIYVPFYS